MRFRLTLIATGLHNVLPCNNQYPLSAAIYKIIQQADGEYAAFLHDRGYQLESGKAFKLFTFSDIRTPFENQGDRLVMTGNRASVLICFHLPQAAENFIRGLFMNQLIEIADWESKVVFTVTGVEALPSGLIRPGVQEMILQPLSPVVCGKKNDKGKYDFLTPENPAFTRFLLHNWKQKYAALHGPARADDVFSNAGMEVILYKNPPKSRLVTIKAGTYKETKIRGFINFRLKVWGDKDALELLMDSGVGLYNALGMGCVGDDQGVRAYNINVKREHIVRQ